MPNSRDFNKHPLTEGERSRRGIAAEVHESLLTPDQISLYKALWKDAEMNALKSKLTLFIPAGTEAKDLQVVLPIFDLMIEPTTEILLAEKMPRDHDLVNKVDKEALRRFADKNDMLESRSVKRMLGEIPERAQKPSRNVEAENAAVFDRLKAHFQEAAVKCPKYAERFEAELETYKKVLIDGDMQAMDTLAKKFAAMTGTPTEPPEIIKVLKSAIEIYSARP